MLSQDQTMPSTAPDGVSQHSQTQPSQVIDLKHMHDQTWRSYKTIHHRSISSQLHSASIWHIDKIHPCPIDNMPHLPPPLAVRTPGGRRDHWHIVVQVLLLLSVATRLTQSMSSGSTQQQRGGDEICETLPSEIHLIKGSTRRHLSTLTLVTLTTIHKFVRIPTPHRQRNTTSSVDCSAPATAKCR